MRSIHIYREEERRIYRNSGHLDKCTGRHVVRLSGRHVDRWSDGHVDRWSGGQVDSWTGGQSVNTLRRYNMVVCLCVCVQLSLLQSHPLQGILGLLANE